MSSSSSRACLFRYPEKIVELFKRPVVQVEREILPEAAQAQQRQGANSLGQRFRLLHGSLSLQSDKLPRSNHSAIERRKWTSGETS